MFWKKRLRDVREELKADALAKLKSKCPTLFAMGWFKVSHFRLNIVFIRIESKK